MQRAAAAGIPLPRELGLHIIADVCRALAYAHGKTDGTRPLGIVHRDVSPHNILLSEQGEIKLTDFGIAKAMNKREQTGTGVVKGKVAFMSPEQAMGKPIDQRSDLFSLGTVLYLLMVRSRPFEGPTDLETLLRVQKGDFLPPEAAAPDLEPEVAAIINRALKLDPNERYQSADEMLADIEHVARNVFRAVGQTELKRWLAELALQDGQPSILKMTSRSTAGRTGTRDAASSTGRTSCCPTRRRFTRTRSTPRRGRRWRSSRRRAAGACGCRARACRSSRGCSLPVPRDAESELDGRASEELAAMQVPETEEPPDRRRKRSGGGFFKLVFVGGLLVGGAWFGGKYYRTWFGGGEGAPAGGAARSKTKPVAETPAPAAKPTPEAGAERRRRSRPPRPNRQRRRGRGAKPPRSTAKEDAKAEKPSPRAAPRARKAPPPNASCP